MFDLRLLTVSCTLMLAGATFAQETLTPPAAKPKPAHPAAALRLDEDIPWIKDPETVFDSWPNQWGLSAKVDRAALMDEALAKSKSTGKLVLWYVPRIFDDKNHGQQMYRAPVLDLYMRQVIFTDPDVAGILASRFVPLRLNCDEKLAARFSLRPLDVIEPMLVVLDGEGKVLHKLQRIRTFSAHWTAHVLRKALQRFEPVLAGRPSNTSPETAEIAQREGRWEEGLQMLERKQEKSEADWLQIAGLQRRLRLTGEGDAPTALEHVEIKRTRGGMGASAAAAETEIGALLTLQGKPAEAVKHLDAAARAKANPRRAEAGYLLAANALKLGDETRAMRTFEQVAMQSPDDPWGRMAQANLVLGPDERPLGATFSGFECLTWLPKAAYEGLPEDTAAHGLDAAPARDIALPALEFLLSMQRDHGGFCDSRYAYWDTPLITPNAWLAITALSASALLEWRELAPERVDRALRRAEEFMFDDSRINRGKNEDVYVDSYRLVYLARKVQRSEAAQKQQSIARMNQIVVEAGKRQLAGGFWAHEYPNAFATGAMLWGAFVAREAGATVPQDMIEKGTLALLSARFSSGAFTYGGSAPKQNEQDPEEEPSPQAKKSISEAVKNASGRMPACEGALFVFQKSNEAKIKAAFDGFWEYMGRLEKVRRNDFHSDGELAGFFFFHDLFHASEVNKKIPPDLRTLNEQQFRALIRRIPEIDGSFVDSHEIGRSYGTAMALLILKNVG